MRLFKYITSVRPAINFILLVAVFSIVIIDGWLNSIPEVVPWGNEFGEIYFKICLSIISSYVFYFIVVHVKSVQDKENIGVFVSGKVRNVIGDYKSQIRELKKAANNSSDSEYFEKNDIESILKSINPKSQAPLILGGLGNYANWLQYLDYHKSRSQGFIQKVFVKMPFLESQLVSLLAKIDDCTHFMVLEHTANRQLNNTDMEAWASGFYDYAILCKELEDYHEKNLSQYSQNRNSPNK
jgi:hypothetical protein